MPGTIASDCFRILRRTCARHYLQFTYYEERRNDSRVNYVLVFDGRPPQLGLASADFALEMRAVSMLQRHPRRRRATATTSSRTLRTVRSTARIGSSPSGNTPRWVTK